MAKEEYLESARTLARCAVNNKKHIIELCKYRERIIKNFSEEIRNTQTEITSAEAVITGTGKKLYVSISRYPQKKDILIKEYESAVRLFSDLEKSSGSSSSSSDSSSSLSSSYPLNRSSSSQVEEDLKPIKKLIQGTPSHIAAHTKYIIGLYKYQERIIKKISENIRKIQIEITSSKVESLKILNTLYNIIDNHPQKKDVVIKEYESALRLFSDTEKSFSSSSSSSDSSSSLSSSYSSDSPILPDSIPSVEVLPTGEQASGKSDSAI